MKRDFDIDLDFPLDSLCPAVPNRLNYILWLEDLVSETMQDDKIRGIDIGVGASCIYPLLGCARNPHWTFLGTDINHRSIEWAQENVRKNGLEDRIKIRHNDDPEKILVIGEEKYTFCMCNPPFYESQEELERGLVNKELEPSADDQRKFRDTDTHQMVHEHDWSKEIHMAPRPAVEGVWDHKLSGH
ncbi:hypothetical protein RMCBS344292_05745 [Rhizopus microsporus]|nr:hypothetical protein RMCBS344292_05745 [Rhizopus microsporus]